MSCWLCRACTAEVVNVNVCNHYSLGLCCRAGYMVSWSVDWSVLCVAPEWPVRAHDYDLIVAVRGFCFNGGRSAFRFVSCTFVC